MLGGGGGGGDDGGGETIDRHYSDQEAVSLAAASNTPQVASAADTDELYSTDDDEFGELAAGTDAENLKRVVTQLRGEIEAGSIPQVRTRVALDGLFAELRDDPATSTATAGHRSSTTANGFVGTSPLNGTARIAGDPRHRPEDSRKPKKGESTDEITASVGGGSDDDSCGDSDTCSGMMGGDLESLSDMLSRLQANAQARDLAAAGARAAVLRSGAPISDSFSAIIANTGNEMRSRFASIRKGRVSWAILPLIFRAQDAGIFLSTGVYNAAIAAYLGTPRKYRDALRVLNMLRSSKDADVRPDMNSYNTAMRVCGEAGKWRPVLQVNISEGFSNVTGFAHPQYFFCLPLLIA